MTTLVPAWAISIANPDVIFKLQPPEMLPESSVPSFNINKLHVPLGSVPLKTESAVGELDVPGAAGDGKSKGSVGNPNKGKALKG